MSRDKEHINQLTCWVVTCFAKTQIFYINLRVKTVLQMPDIVSPGKVN